MKKLIYKVEGYSTVYNPETNADEQHLSLAMVVVKNPTDADIARASEIAYNGEYTIDDDGQPDPESPAEESTVWAELDAAYQEGVDSV